MVQGMAIRRETFRKIFAKDMNAIVGNSCYLYGTHSFRRGGCQYYYCELGWNLKRVCDWGGWSTEFDNLTIVKYLVGHLDNETCERRDYLKPTNMHNIRAMLPSTQ